MTNYPQEFREAWRQREAERPPRGPIPLTRRDDVVLHVSLARFYLELGHPALADLMLGHARIAEVDCPAGCHCPGCELTRAEAEEARARRTERGRVRQAKAVTA